MPPRAWRPASRFGSACRSTTRRTGTPTGRTPATPACRPLWPGPCRPASRPVRSSGRCRSKLPVGPLVNYGYEGPLLLPVALKLPAALPAGPIKIQLAANWLVCKELCIPESGEFTLELPQGQAIAGQAARLSQARQQLPQACRLRPGARRRRDPGHRGARPARRLAGPAGQLLRRRGRRHRPRPARNQASWEGEHAEAARRPEPAAQREPDPVSAVLRVGEQTGELRFALQGGWPTAAGAPLLRRALQPARSRCPRPAAGFLLSLLLAFAGGLLLEPDALRVPGAQPEGPGPGQRGTARAPCGRGRLHGGRGAELPGPGRAAAGLARRRQPDRLGLPAAGAAGGRRPWRCCSR